MEAADLGVRLCQRSARSLYACHLSVAVPVAALTLASYEIGSSLPALLLWWAKPWLDRTSLFVLSRAAFGVPTQPIDVWRAQRHVWWSQWLSTWTLRRLSPWRSLTQPVYQLEGLSWRGIRARVPYIRRRQAGSAFLVTVAFVVMETVLTLSLFSLTYWFAPSDQTSGLMAILTGDILNVASIAYAISYAGAVLFLEPFYVAAGFAMYLNRRAELEAWDIEQEFRRAFAR